jgi:hypothetical protein
MGVLRTIFIIIIVFQVLKIISRFAFPVLMKRFVGKMEERMRQQQGHQQQDNTKVGETIIDKKPNDKTSNKDVGEYVDFEEVD